MRFTFRFKTDCKRIFPNEIDKNNPFFKIAEPIFFTQIVLYDYTNAFLFISSYTVVISECLYVSIILKYLF